jgi:hypothetical protein
MGILMETSPPAASDPAAAASWTYRLFGLDVRSEIELAAAPQTGGGEPDIQILRRTITPPQSTFGAEPYVAFEEGLSYFYWSTIGAFTVRGRSLIEVDPIPSASDELLALPLMGTVIATLLHQRGTLVLHASAVDIAGQGVAFLGDKGAGKSTTIAAFVAAGHGLITDDVLALDMSGAKEPRFAAGFREIKLCEDAASRSHLTNATYAQSPHPEYRKVQVRLPETVGAAARRLYVLSRGPELAIKPLSRPEALWAFVRYSHGARFGPSLLQGPAAAAHLRLCAQAAENVDVRRLEIPEDPNILESAVALIEADLA